MSVESRTLKSIKNAKVALVFYLINLILQFFSRKFFLVYLGTEVLGLNTTAQNLLGFLNLAELGIGSAIAYTLYKPLLNHNRQAINEIVSIQGWMYRRIAYVVIAGACVLMCFFPWIFAKAKVPLWYTYGSFGSLLISSLLGYFVNYRQIILTADQKEYIITLNIQGVKILKVVLQILAIRYMNNGYVYWMILEGFMAFVTAILLDCVLKRNYPWLKTEVWQGGILRKRYPEIITKTKQIFFHQISGFVLLQTSPLVIYAYTSLTLVAIYGNYVLIVNGITLLLSSILNGVLAGVGNLIAEGDKEHIKKVFWDLTALRIWLASVVCWGIYKLAHSFITLWVGSEYVLPQMPFIILLLITFITLARTNIDIFLHAFGLFQDIWAPVTEAILNIICSLLFGYFWGITGILSGVLVSLIVMVCGWKSYFLYRYGFKEKIREYIMQHLKFFLFIFLSVCLSVWISEKWIKNQSVSTFEDWGIYAFQIMTVYFFISLVFFGLGDSGIRNIMKRIWKVIR